MHVSLWADFGTDKQDQADQDVPLRTGGPGYAADYANRRPVLCAHADDGGRGAHWLTPGKKCAAELASRDVDAETEREAG